MKLSRLLESTPKWQHKNAKVRLKALEATDISAEAIHSLAEKDPDLSVRLRAISLLNDHRALWALTESSPSEVIIAARARWITIVGSDLTRFDLVTEHLPLELLLTLATEAGELDIRCKAASYINDENILEKILSGNNHSRVHQLCATKITDEALLETTQKRFLDKDKNVSRIVKGKLQEIKLYREREQAFQVELESCITQIEKLAGSEIAEGYERKLSVIEDSWQHLNREHTIPEQTTSQFHQAQQSCKAALARIEEEKIAVTNTINETLATLAMFTRTLKTSPDKIDTIAQVLSDARKRWPAGQDLNVFYELSTPLEQLAQQQTSWLKLQQEKGKLKPEEIIKQITLIHWPEIFTAPAEIAELRSEIEVLLTKKSESKAQHEAKIDELDQQLKKLVHSIEEGHPKQATKLLTSLHKKLETFSAPQRFVSEVHNAATKLAELKDWQGYATNPKREELCLTMEALAKDTVIHPQDKANQIKDLQDQWKALGPSDSRQGQRLWSRFKKQGDLAFAPCSVFFAQQRDVREQNLVEKRKICSSLELFFEQNDWQHTNWKAANEILNKARQEWRQYEDIPRAKRKKLADRFHKALTALQEKLRTEQDRNHDLKSALINEITEMLDSENPIAQIIDNTKAAQAAWKKIGITNHNVDQKLWKKFRTECDKVFNKRDEQKVVQKQKADEATTQARKVCQDFSAFLNSDQPVSQSDINRFKKEFEAINTAKSSANQTSIVNKEFQKLTRSARKIISEQAVATGKQMMVELKRLAELCTALETGKIDETALGNSWPGEIELEKKMLNGITLRRQGQTIKDSDNAELLCIKLEVLAEIESPEQSQGARMAYQVDRLKKELSQGLKETRSKNEQSRDIQIDWYCLPTSDNKQNVEDRFSRAEAKLGMV